MGLERARGEIVRLVHRGLGVQDFSLAAAHALRHTVPFDGVCLLTVDPATLLPTGEVVQNGLPGAAMARLMEIELGEPDYNKFTALNRAARPAASLSDATRGRLDESLRQRELRRPSGFGDELRAVLVSDAEAWGALTLLRERGRPHFTEHEVCHVTSLAGAVAEGLRRALLLGGSVGGSVGGSDGGAAASDAPAVGLVLLRDDNSIERANAVAHELLDELAPAGANDEHVPIVVQAVAHRARRVAGGEVPDDVIASTRVRARSGRWLIVHGSVLGDGPVAQVAVVVEPAHVPELAPLIAAAYGLTERERKVTQLVAQGLSTTDVAARLHLSAWTVQDHLKSIFSKTGTGTRGELVARVFFDHYAARLSS